jgi:hypothetical protein
MRSVNQCRSGSSRDLVFLGLALTAALLGDGCSSDREVARDAALRIYTPLPPAFLTSPAALLLTNGGGWSAHVAFQTAELLEPHQGELEVLGSKLRFIPEYPRPERKLGRTGGFSFIWDVAEYRGYVLSDGLQGYAPLTATLRPTNSTAADTTGPQRYEGYTCKAQDITVQLNDGSTASFHVLRATDTGDLPLQISAQKGPVPMTLNVTKVRRQPPPTEVVALPDGFTHYSSAEVMADELAARERNLRRPRYSTGSEIIYQTPTTR